MSDGSQMHEANLLYLETCKAQSQLMWFPRWDIETTIAETVKWYKEFENNDPFDICKEQIRSYHQQVKEQELELAQI